MNRPDDPTPSPIDFYAGESRRLAKCGECGALVEPIDWKDHHRFHKNLMKWLGLAGVIVRRERIQ